MRVRSSRDLMPKFRVELENASGVGRCVRSLSHRCSDPGPARVSPFVPNHAWSHGAAEDLPASERLAWSPISVVHGLLCVSGALRDSPLK
jgi:hypothetical protein